MVQVFTTLSLKREIIKGRIHDASVGKRVGEVMV